MNYLLIEYPKCSTCQKAKKWLEENKIEYIDRHIIQDCPTIEELTQWMEKSGLPLRRFFNTSGMKYKELNLKEKLPNLNTKEQLRLLSTNGMLLKRPLLIGQDTILVGFRKEQWETTLLKK